VKINTFSMLKPLHNHPRMIPLSVVMLFLQTVDPLVMQGSLLLSTVQSNPMFGSS